MKLMKLIDNAPKEIQEAMRDITDCFSGADGDGFYKLCMLIRILSDDKNNQNTTKKLFDVIIKFSKLVNSARKAYH